MSAFLNSAGGQHLIAGLAIIGALAGLGATGTIDGGAALAGITGVGGVLLGSSAVNLGATTSTTTSSQATFPSK